MFLFLCRNQQYDRVLVLDMGTIAEFDSPANLLRNPKSHLSSMVAETGPDNAVMLRQVAMAAEAHREAAAQK